MHMSSKLNMQVRTQKGLFLCKSLALNTNHLIEGLEGFHLQKLVMGRNIFNFRSVAIALEMADALSD